MTEPQIDYYYFTVKQVDIEVVNFNLKSLVRSKSDYHSSLKEMIKSLFTV